MSNGPWLPLSPAKPPEQMHPIALAYIGDAIFEVYIRQYVLSQDNHRPHHLHKHTTQYVAAKAQAKALEMLSPTLSEEELTVVKRGRNAKSGSAPKHAEMIDYRNSTAFECLLGYLFYKQRYDRLAELMDLIIQEMEGE